MDTSTWYLVPDACLIGALELVDRSPETAVTGSQAARLLRVMEDGTEPSQAVAAADAQMVFTAQAVLTPDQLALMDGNRAEFLGSSPDVDVDALSEALGNAADFPLAPRAPERPLSPSVRPLYSAVYMLAGLAYLNDAGALFRNQATVLRPLVACVIERRRARTEIYRKATEILTQEQAVRLARFLAEMRTGQRSLQGPSPDFVARLAQRARSL